MLREPVRFAMISKKILIYLLVLTIGLSICVCAEYLGLFEGIDNFTYDISFRIRGQKKPSDTIIIAAIDEKSLGKMGRWPINREYYAKLLDVTRQAGAVGFDIIMAEPSDGDPLLREAINRHGRVILPTYIDSRKSVVFPAALFSTAKPGHIHIEPDIDGVARKVFQTLRIKHILLPSFASAVCETVTGRPPDEVMLRAKPPIIQQGEILQGSMMKINYYGPPGTFRHVSLADIIDGTYPEDFFRGKIVLVGLTAIGLEDRLLTPFSQQRDRMAGVEVQANILSNLISHNYIRDVDGWIKWLFSFTLSFVVIFLLLRVNPRGIKLFIWWAFGMFALTGASTGLFAYFNLWLAPSFPGFSLTLTFVMGYIFRLETVGQQLLESKNNWEHTFDAIDDAVVILDKECAIIQMNEAAQKSYGQEFLKAYCLKFFERNRQTFNTPQGTQKSTQSLQGKIATEEIFDNSLNKYLEIRCLPRFDKHDNLEGVVLVIRNISSRKKAEEEQRMMQSQLFQSQKMEAVGLLAGGIAHDFNNMLTVIIGLASLLALKIDKESELKVYVDQILSSAEKSANLTRQLLAFSRKQTFALCETELNKLVRGLEKLLLRIIGEDIELKVRLSNYDITVMADPGQIEQVLMNLSTNARDAMPNGGLLSIDTKTVALASGYIKMHGLEKTGEYAVISLSDTGTGMDEETRQKIFEPFFTTKELGRGTGLGLSTVYGIIKQHNGNITVYSLPGGGTTFRIYLPLTKSVSGKTKSAEVAAPKGHGETILVAEDNADVGSLLRQVLEASGYKVIEAIDGEDAIIKFLAHSDQIKLVILDVIMPKKSGKEAGDEIKKIQPDMKILFASGYTADVINKKGILEEGIDFISKPVTPNDLLTKVRKMIERNTG